LSLKTALQHWQIPIMSFESQGVEEVEEEEEEKRMCS
jgi:hypothetical protein